MDRVSAPEAPLPPAASACWVCSSVAIPVSPTLDAEVRAELSQHASFAQDGEEFLGDPLVVAHRRGGVAADEEPLPLEVRVPLVVLVPLGAGEVVVSVGLDHDPRLLPEKVDLVA